MNDPWLVYADLDSANNGLTEINYSYGYPNVGENAETGNPAPLAQRTTQWADARQREDGQFCFPKPPDDHMPTVQEYAIEEYDPAWFPPPSLP